MSNGSGGLGGTIGVTAVNGVATFSALKLSQAGSGNTLEFTASGLASATSSSITVTSFVIPQYELKTVSSGIWLFNSATATWQQLSTANSSGGLVEAILSPNGPDVLAEFSSTGAGLWRWETTGQSAPGWTQITTADTASEVSVNNRGDVVGFFSGSGVWRYEDATGWQQLSQSGSPSFLSLNSVGDVLATFSGAGIWRYQDAAGWQQLTTADANQVGMNDVGDVFGVYSNGIWRYEDSTSWQQITSATNFTELTMNNRGDLTAFFTGSGSGIWRYEDAAGWQQLSSSGSPTSLTLNDEGDLLALFSGAGIWRYEDAVGWQQITPADPLFTNFGPNGDVLAEYPGSIWLYQTGWVNLNATPPT